MFVALKCALYCAYRAYHKDLGPHQHSASIKHLEKGMFNSHEIIPLGALQHSLQYYDALPTFGIKAVQAGEDVHGRNRDDVD